MLLCRWRRWIALRFGLGFLRSAYANSLVLSCETSRSSAVFAYRPIALLLLDFGWLLLAKVVLVDLLSAFVPHSEESRFEWVRLVALRRQWVRVPSEGFECRSDGE